MEIFLCSPMLDQTCTIAKLIKCYLPETKICGVLFTEKKHPKVHYIDAYYDFSAIDLHMLTGRIMPTGAESTKELLLHGDIVFNGIILSRSALQVFDKKWMLEQAKASGIPIPETWFEISKIACYPVFYKQKFEKGGGIRGVAGSHSQIPTADREDLLYQEYIDSPGTYGVGFIAKDGDILGSHVHFERESIPKSGGSAVIIEIAQNPCIEEYTKRIIKRINYSGWGLAEFKYCPKRNDFVFMEINARLWASCELAFANEPSFARCLFGIEKPSEHVNRIVFLDRFLRRGLLFSLMNIPYLFNSRIVHHSSVLKSFLLGTIETTWLKRLISRWRRIT